MSEVKYKTTAKEFVQQKLGDDYKHARVSLNRGEIEQWLDEYNDKNHNRIECGQIVEKGNEERYIQSATRDILKVISDLCLIKVSKEDKDGKALVQLSIKILM